MKKNILILACLLGIAMTQAHAYNNGSSKKAQVWESPATEVNTEIEGYSVYFTKSPVWNLPRKRPAL